VKALIFPAHEMNSRAVGEFGLLWLSPNTPFEPTPSVDSFTSSFSSSFLSLSSLLCGSLDKSFSCLFNRPGQQLPVSRLTMLTVLPSFLWGLLFHSPTTLPPTFDSPHFSANCLPFHRDLYTPSAINVASAPLPRLLEISSPPTVYFLILMLSQLLF